MTRFAINSHECPRVVILGASGFVGGTLSQFLQAERVSFVPLTSVDVDLCSSSSVDQLMKIVRPADALVIASAITPDKGNDVHALMRNLSMGRYLGEFLESKPCSHVIYLSSDAVYADDSGLIDEQTVPNPSTLYGSMHLLREKIIGQSLNTDVPYLVLRLCALFGPGDTHNSYGPNRFIRTAAGSNLISLFGTGEERRDHVYIDDVSRLIFEAFQQRRTGILNVATGISRSFHDVAQKVASSVSNRVDIEFLPRRAPILHRHFDTRALMKAFPRFLFSEFDQALAMSLKDILSTPTV